MNTKKAPKQKKNQQTKANSNRKAKKQPHEQEHIATRMFD
jgi:hypothetical protein